MYILEANNLSYKLPNKEEYLLENINFKVKEGSFVLISGRSGCGKSMLLKCLNGIIPNYYDGQVEGEILYKKTNLQDLCKEEIVKHMGFMWQDVDYQIINMNVKEELVFGLENLGYSIEEMDRRLDYLKEFINVDFHEEIDNLSGGQKQKVAMGSLIAMNQDILLLDEPLANLDFESVIQVLEFLKQLTLMGKTVIIIEHRLEEALTYVDHLIYLEDKTIKYDFRDKKKIEEFRKNHFQFEEIKKDRAENRNEVAINCRDLSFTYKKHKNNALDNINIGFSKGERIIILGKNGSGKSTLLKCLCGIVKKRKTKNKELKVNGSIGYVFQNPTHQLFMKTVYDEVDLNSTDKSYTEYILELFNLDKLRDNHPLSLSQGQRRLLAIASIVSSKPDILFLDEPTIGQDYESLKTITNILNMLNERNNMTIVTVTHDEFCAKLLCDEVVILNEGKVLKTGKADLIDQFFEEIKIEEINENYTMKA